MKSKEITRGEQRGVKEKICRLDQEGIIRLEIRKHDWYLILMNYYYYFRILQPKTENI